MGSRRSGRELALQYLFGHEFRAESKGESEGESRQNASTPNHKQLSPREWMRQYSEDFSVEPEIAEFSEELCEGVLEHQKSIDPIIQSHSSHWKISRMSLVDINILRLAVYEMHFSSHPISPKIVMNEAIEIAKLYGTLESGAFVNGIIDQIARSLGSVHQIG